MPTYHISNNCKLNGNTLVYVFAEHSLHLRVQMLYQDSDLQVLVQALQQQNFDPK